MLRSIWNKGKSQGTEKLLLALVNHQKLPRILKYMLDESEFLSPYGLRSLSRYYLDHPYNLEDGWRQPSRRL